MTNQLLIVMDDMKTDLLGHLPHTMSVAAQGTSFLHRLNTALCQVYRATIFTGQWSKDHGIYDNAYATLDAQGFTNPAAHPTTTLWNKTIQQPLSTAGVWCGFIGKEFNFGAPSDDYQSGQHQIGSGWDYWRSITNAYDIVASVPQQLSLGYRVWDGTSASNPSPYYLDFLYAKLVEAIAAATEPWFIEVAVTSPHTPLNPKPEDNHAWERYDYDLIEETHLSLRPSWVQARDPISVSDLYHIRDYVRRSLREAQAVDRFTRDAIALVGGLATTDVILTNDNSIHAGEALMRLNDTTGGVFKNTPYDASMKVHCICAGPSYPSDGRYVNVPTSNIDIPATLMATAGATPLLTKQHGVDLRDVAVNSSAYASRELLHQSRYGGVGSVPDWDAISTLTRKLIRYQSPATGTDVNELYALDTDPYELHNRGNDSTNNDPETGAHWTSTVSTLSTALDALLAL